LTRAIEFYIWLRKNFYRSNKPVERYEIENTGERNCEKHRSKTDEHLQAHASYDNGLLNHFMKYFN
jgi:hypothetical protein